MTALLHLQQGKLKPAFRTMLIIFLLGILACNPVREKTGQQETTQIPVYDFSGLEPILQKRNDTTYVVNFWATWCKPCVKEMPAFLKLDSLYSERKVKVILVSLDFPNKLEERVIPFVEENNIRPEVVLLNDPDANAWIDKVDPGWSGAIPATVIFNKNGREFYERSFTFEELEKIVTSKMIQS